MPNARARFKILNAGAYLEIHRLEWIKEAAECIAEKALEIQAHFELVQPGRQIHRAEHAKRLKLIHRGFRLRQIQVCELAQQ